MNLSFVSFPVDALSGDIAVPGDKSISHRALIFGAIAEGVSSITGFLASEDCMATLRALQAMGVQIDELKTEPPRVVIHGVGKYGLQKPDAPLDCGNSGTSMRLLAGLLAAQSFDSELTGDASLLKRPMERVSRPLVLMGADVLTRPNGRPPLLIRGGHTLHGICYDMPQASAQVKSCVLLAGLYATGETQVSEPGLTRDHTERMLTSFSYPLCKSENKVSLNGARECQATDIMVPGDMSSAAFFIVAATLIPGACLNIRGVGINPTRMGVIHILKQMGADIELTNQRLYGEEPVADITVSYAPLEGIDIPVSLVPTAIDEFPILFIAAACAKGATVLHGAAELRCKESDRIVAMVDGLTQLGIDAEALDDGVFIHGGTLQGGVVDSHGDHRVAMAFAIAGAVADSAVTIKQCEKVSTSFPNFVDLANQIHLSIRVLNDGL
jgi:3-phosphoshikimate 1-carboxyvinyltransferase